MQIKNKLGIPLAAFALALSAGGGMVAAAHAAGTTAAPAAAAVPDSARAHRHAPLGGDGIVSSINGSTIVMAEESDEGGASYTVDASNATVTKNGASASLSGIAVGDKIFVRGTTTGTNVVATSINDGHGAHKGHGGRMGHGMKPAAAAASSSAQ